MQHAWVARERELVEENDHLKAEAAAATAALEENAQLKAEANAAMKAAAEEVKEAKEGKEALRTCKLDTDYHLEVAEKKTAVASDLQNNLEAESLKCEHLALQVKHLEEEKSRLLEEHVEELEDSIDAIKIYFSMFWKHNRNANFSYLHADAFAADEVKCLECPVEEEAAAARKDATPKILRLNSFILKFYQVLHASNFHDY